jgi:hypothetical protein
VAYTPPQEVSLGNTTVQVTDSTGESALATIEVKAGLSLRVSSILLPVNGVFTLTSVTSGGVGDISYSAAQGSVVGAVYTAPAVPGTYPIQVRDSQSPLPNQASS